VKKKRIKKFTGGGVLGTGLVSGPSVVLRRIGTGGKLTLRLLTRRGQKGSNEGGPFLLAEINWGPQLMENADFDEEKELEEGEVFTERKVRESVSSSWEGTARDIALFAPTRWEKMQTGKKDRPCFGRGATKLGRRRGGKEQRREWLSSCCYKENRRNCKKRGAIASSGAGNRRHGRCDDHTTACLNERGGEEGPER